MAADALEDGECDGAELGRGVDDDEGDGEESWLSIPFFIATRIAIQKPKRGG